MWSVIAIAPRPRSRAVSSRTSTGVAQSGEWSVCMWRSTSISGRPAIRRADLGVAGRVVAAGEEPPVDRLELVGDRVPVAPLARRLDQLVGAGEVALEQLAVAGVATVRASRRPKKISTSGRATWVERTRSCGAWKVATLSE